MARSLSRVAKLVAAGDATLPENQFIKKLTTTIETTQSEYTPSTYYKPSGVGGCIRKMYFERIGKPLPEIPNAMLIAMGETGTQRHEVLQSYLVKLSDMDDDFEWLDVAEYLKDNPVEGTEVDKNFKKNEFETKCKNALLQLSFLCDGLIRLNGKTYILEIKTETMFKYNKQTEPFPEHKMQATCYGLCLGVDDVLFLYENRDTFEKKAYTYHINDEMKDQVVEKLNTCEYYVEKKESPKIFCGSTYCPYCKKQNRDM